jgi:hypothetical protein
MKSPYGLNILDDCKTCPVHPGTNHLPGTKVGQIAAALGCRAGRFRPFATSALGTDAWGNRVDDWHQPRDRQPPVFRLQDEALHSVERFQFSDPQ